MTNVARVSSTTTTTDPNAADNRSEVTSSIAEIADLSIVKTGPGSVNAGDTVLYEITTTNNGPSAASSVAVTDSLPAGVTFVSANRGATEASGVVTWPTIGSLTNGATQVDTVIVVAPASGSITNVARAATITTDPNTADNRSEVTTSIGEIADLAIVKTGPGSVNAGDTVVYEITTTNSGPSSAANVAVTDSLPSGGTFVSASRGATEAAGVVTWPAIGSLVNGASQVDTVIVVAPASGSITNVARATTSTTDPNAADNRSEVTSSIAEIADLAIVKTGPGSVNAGDTVVYEITTTNSGPSAASSVVVRDSLPAGVTFISANRGATEAAGVVTWPSIGSLVNGATQVDTVIVVAPASGSITNVARAATTTTDPNTADNRSEVTTSISELADLAIVKTGPASVNAGDTVVYEITTTNSGLSSAANVAVTDSLPAGVTFVSANRGATGAAGVVTWPTVGSLTNGATQVDTVIVVAPASGSITNVVRATTSTTDPNAADNRSEITTSISELADLSIVKTGPSSVNAGDTVVYEITTTNNGPSAAASVTVIDSLPAGVTFISANRGATEAAGVVTWPTIGSLVNGATQVDTVIVVAPASGSITNVVRATTSTTDPNAADNRSEVTTSIGEVADLAIVKTGPASVNAGDTVLYEITTTNNGPSAASSVVVTDSLPAGVTFVSANRGASETAGVVNWPTMGSLANGATQVDTVMVVAPTSGSITNVARATTSTTDPNAADNRSEVTTSIADIAHLAIVKTGPASVNAGDTVVYEITTNNNGPSSASNVAVADSLPAGVTFLSANRGATEAAGVVTWPLIGSLANGSDPGRHCDRRRARLRLHHQCGACDNDDDRSERSRQPV